jgi:HEPN domain-containing protein
MVSAMGEPTLSGLIQSMFSSEMDERQTQRVFTREAMSRPLFEEPGDHIVRENPMSGPQGFMVGDEFIPTRIEMAQQYFDAAHLLLESIKRGEWEDYKLVSPALFLYRHSLELLVKGLLGVSPRTHDLSELADRLEAVSVERWGRSMPTWIISRLKEIAAIDPGSTAFRYGENYDPSLKATVSPVPSAMYVSLPHLQRAMLTLNAALKGAIAEVAMNHPIRYFEELDFIDE